MSNCTIYNKSFLDDLTDLRTSIDNATINIQKLSDLISTINSVEDIWTPLFINKSSSSITQKMLSDHGSMMSYDNNSNLLGIQNFITINNPTFNFWNITNGYMSTDWLLNNSSSSHYTIYGLLCWFKKLPISTNTGNIISFFPNNSRLQLIDSIRTFIKIDNETLYEINDSNKNSSRFNNNGSISFNFNQEQANNNYVKVSEIGQNPLFILTKNFNKENRSLESSFSTNSYNGITINDNNYVFWIPNGDVYSYYSTYDEFRSNAISNNSLKTIPKTFCSSSLYSLYNNIYYQLTYHENKNHDSLISIKNHRKYKALAKYLSTSPYIDENSINLLADAQFDNGSYSHGENDDFNDVVPLLNRAIEYINQNQNNYQTLNNNFIYNEYSLKEKLIQKYGSKLVFNNGGLSTKNDLKHGANIVVGQIGSYWTSQNVSDLILHGNQTVGIGGLQIRTDFTDKKSHIVLDSPNTLPEQKTKIYLYDAVKPKIKNSNSINVVMEKTTNDSLLPEYNDTTIFNLPINNVFKYRLDEGEARDGLNLIDLIKFNLIVNDLDVESYRSSEDPFNPSTIISQNYINCIWSQVSGPQLKFVDLNKYTTGSKIGGSDNFERDVNLGILEDKITGNEVYIRPSTSGRYQIKCDISTPFGNFVKIKTFYVLFGFAISSTQPAIYFQEENISIENSIFFNIAQDKIYTSQRESNPIFLNNDNLRVHLPNLKKIAINSNGLFYPVNTNLTVKGTQRAPSSLSGDLFKFQFFQSGSSRNSILNIIYSLQTNIVYKLDRIILENTRNNNDPECANCFSFYYPQLYGSNGRWTRQENGVVLEGWDVDNNDIISMGQQNYFWPPISTDYSPSIKPYGGYSTNIINNIGLIFPDHPAPGEIFPPVTGRPLDYKSDNPSSDPPHYTDDGRKFCFENILPQPTNNYLTFDKGVFHPYSGWIQHSNPLYDSVKNLSSVLKFNPAARDSFNFTGPAINDIQNYSYIVPTGDSNLSIIAKTFRSEIDLQMSIGSQWIQYSKSCDETIRGPVATKPKTAPIDWVWRNQIHREYADQALNKRNFGEVGKYYNHGYRILEGGSAKEAESNFNNNKNPVIDEFGFSSNKINNRFIYRFPTFGYHYPIEEIPSFITDYWKNLNSQFEPSSGSEEPPEPTGQWRGLKNPRVPNFTIQDIEVKLNFLNYVNTKDLTIVFESSPCGSEAKRINPPCGGASQSSIVDSEKNWIDQSIDSTYDGLLPLPGINNKELELYLRYLTYINSSSSIPLKLYLLNKEYVQNHSFNLNLKFSDNANKYNLLNDSSYINFLKSKSHTGTYTGTDKKLLSIGQRETGQKTSLWGSINNSYYRNIVDYNDSIRPSLCSINFSDHESQVLYNIASVNKLNIKHNTFSKYKNKPLFLDYIPCPCPPSRGGETTESPNHNGVTNFACVITLYGEHDDMFPNDNVIDSAAYTNLYDFDHKLNTSQFFNSLCGWELLLHISNTIKPHVPLTSSLHSYASNDSLSLIDYGRTPRYPGYSFIANLKNYKHLLPYVNINAPNIFYQSSSLCETSDVRNIGRSLRYADIEFPSLAIIQILEAMATAAGLGAAGGLVGVSAGLALGGAMSAPAYAAIRGYFDSLRQQRFASSVSNDTYHQDYTSYPFGSPEKILINFSKDELFWYKAEASIFKYKNTPVLPYKKYSYARLNKNSFPSLSRFSFDLVKNISDLIDDRYIKNLSIDCDQIDTLNNRINSLNDYSSNNIQRIYDDFTKSSYHIGELVNVSFGNKSEDLICNDGLYLIAEAGQSWISVTEDPMVLHKAGDFISHNDIIYGQSLENNILYNFNQSTIDNKIIIIDNIIPYQMWSVDDQISIKYNNTETDGLARVVAKALIHKDAKSYSVFKLDINMENVEYVYFNNEVVILFQPQSSSDIANNPFNMYGFEKESVNISDPPEIIQSTNSLGSYGDGSLSKEKNTINAPFVYNNLSKLYNIFNNHENDKLKFNNIVFSTGEFPIEHVRATDGGSLPVVRSIGMSIGYPHSITDIISRINTTNFYVVNNNIDNRIISTLEETINEIRNDLYNNIVKQNYHIIYVKNNNFKQLSFVPNDSGYASVENDYEINVPTTAFLGESILDEATFTNLINTLNILEDNTTKNDLELVVGQKGSTNVIINSKNLAYIYKHYESLTEYTKEKQNTEFALRVLYKERDDILNLLNKISLYQTADIILSDDSIEFGKILSENSEKITIEQDSTKKILNKANIKNIVRNFIRNTNLNNIRPQQKAIISLQQPFEWLKSINIYDIVYENNNDDYWINLDPNQSCSIAEELRPKVLVSISYICRPANYQQTIFGTPLLAENNICARKRGSSLQDDIPDLDGVVFTTETRRIRGESYEAYTYSFHNQMIEEIEEKARALNIQPKWKKQTVKRNYHINGKNDIDPIYSNSEILVGVEEVYEVLLSPHEINDGFVLDRKFKDADSSIISSDGVMTGSVPGLEEGRSNSRIPLDSPAGSGLLLNDLSGSLSDPRAEQSTKIYNVCNLDDITTLKVKFRKVPRQVRGIDLLSTIYRYGISSPYQPGPRRTIADPLNPLEIEDLSSSFATPLNNNFYYWRCMEINNTTNSLVPSSTPPFFQLMNEMMYRNFSGSVDRIENKYDTMVSQFLWELIPYEYFIKPPPPDFIGDINTPPNPIV